jgi:hypothetical protein
MTELTTIPSPDYIAAKAELDAAQAEYQDIIKREVATGVRPDAADWDRILARLRAAGEALHATPDQQYLDEIKKAQQDARARNLADELSRVPGAMTSAHPRWHEFCDLLNHELHLHGCSGDGSQLDPDNPGKLWPQPHPTLWLSRTILEFMGLSVDEIDVSFKYFREHGGYCDCEVQMNVDRQ